MFDFLEIFPGKAPEIRVCDVGAMTLGPHSDAYHALIQAGIARVIGFEPVRAECDKLNRLYAPQRIFFPYVIGDGRKRTFYTCNHVMTSSLYPPNTEFVDRFQNLGNLMQVVDVSPVETVRLDDIPELGDVDYLKVDVQGAEADVFDGATRVLARTAVIHTEVEFAPLYRDAPLFSEIDIQLREHGFALHRFAGIAGRMFKPLIANNDLNTPGSQILWADAVYIPDLTQLDRVAPEKLLKLAAVLHMVYGSWDTCAHVLQAYDRLAGGDLASRYISRLMLHANTPPGDVARPAAL